MSLRSLDRTLRNMRDSLAELEAPQDSLKVFRGVEHLRDLSRFKEFARKQLWVVDKDQGVPVTFILRWIQEQIFAAELEARAAGVRPWFIVLKYRRGGVTTLQQALAYWTMWAKPFTKVRTYAHRAGDTREIFDAVSLFYDLQPEMHRHPKTSALTHHIEFPGWRSNYKADTAGATSSGRGSRISRIHLAEAAYYPDLSELNRGLSQTAAPDAAYVLESTPNGRVGKGEAFYRFWQTAKAGESAFIPLFYPWHADPLNRLPLIVPDELGQLTDEEDRMLRRFDLGLEQVKWWRSKRRELVADGRSASSILQEHPNDSESCFLFGGESYYDSDSIDEARAGCRPPIPMDQLELDYGERWNDIEHGRLRIFEEPKEGARYCIGSDPAGGVGRDDSASVGFNVETGEQAFSWNWNRVPPDEFGASILGDREHGLGWLYRGSESSPPSYQVVERNNHGHATLTGLLRVANYPPTHIYHQRDETRDNPSPSPRAGWNHNHPELTAEVGRMLRERFPKIRDEEVVSSIAAVTEEKGRAEFTGRDLAVASGLGALGMRYAAGPSAFAYVGGKVVDLKTGRVVRRKKRE